MDREQDRLDRWGWADPTGEYQGTMAQIQHGFQQAALQRLRARLDAAGIPWDYQGR